MKRIEAQRRANQTQNAKRRGSGLSFGIRLTESELLDIKKACRPGESPGQAIKRLAFPPQ